MRVKAKKYLGQHFLKDENIAYKIADSLSLQSYETVLEVGPGMGVLTKYLLKKPIDLHLVEIDKESVRYLESHFTQLKNKIILDDFLKLDLSKIVGDKPMAIIGNYPYNISTQIVFKALANKEQVVELIGMFQKEVAQRIAEKPGTKAYGILSVLTQAFYEVDYLFTVPPTVFDPPPKVDSGVLRMVRKANYTLPVDEKLFFKVVKTAFNHRRKTLRNSLKSFDLSDTLREDAIFAQRPEQLAVQDFLELTQKIATDAT